MNATQKQHTKSKFGQYFTPKVVADFMVELATVSETAMVLEPSCGEGVFLEALKAKGFKDVSAYEIDGDLAQNFENVQYESFVSANIASKFDLIIGNPPYIRWKNLEDDLKQELSISPLWNKYFNSLCDYLYIFILKSIELLNDNGELIFICPEYWLSTTHSVSLRNYMVEHGYFETMYHFNETPIFDKVTVSILIFKYVKSKQPPPKIKVAKFYANQKLSAVTLQQLKAQTAFANAEYLSVAPFQSNERWLLQSDEVRTELRTLELHCSKKYQNSLLNLFNKDKLAFDTIGDICDIGNGLVSGLDKAFQINGFSLNAAEEKAVLKVVKAKDINPYFANNITQYIYIKEGLSEREFMEIYPNFYAHFQDYKADLEKRYQYNRAINYWEWVFLRNFNLFKNEQKRIFVPCKERISNKDYLRFALLEAGTFPTQDVTAIFKKPSTKERIEYILAYLNSPVIFDWLKCNGIIKGNILEFSEKPIASIPFRLIDWGKPDEIAIHDQITQLTADYLVTKNSENLTLIQQLFQQLFGN